MFGGICNISWLEIGIDPVVPRQENSYLELRESKKGFLVLGSARAMQVKTTYGIICVHHIAGDEDLMLAIV